MKVEQYLPGDREKIRNFLPLIKRIVERGWLDDTEGFVEGDTAVEILAQGIQRQQR